MFYIIYLEIIFNVNHSFSSKTTKIEIQSMHKITSLQKKIKYKYSQIKFNRLKVEFVKN